MMFPGSIEFVMRERHKDLQREAEHMRLIKALEHEESVNGGLWRKAASALGNQMVVWGTKLQNVSSPVNTVDVVEPECC